MRVLVLSPQADLLIPALKTCGDEAVLPSWRQDLRVEGGERAPYECPPDEWPDADYVVMFNYRHIVRGEKLNQYKNRIINIHTSVLPYNRGAHPNFWSWFDDTPKGVSILRIDGGIDTGELLSCIGLQYFRPLRTLRTTYDDLIVAAGGLFRKQWPGLREVLYHPINTKYQTRTPSYHRRADISPFMAMLPYGWDTPVSEVALLGKIYRGEVWDDLR